jgi:toxin ParE1/3/4
MRVRYTARAFADREAIFAYLDRRNPRVARDVKAYIHKRILELGDLSRRSPLVPGLGVHALWIGRYPYIVYYRVGATEISVIHIRHAARQTWAGD